MIMTFTTTTPESEEDILILVEDWESNYIVQGEYLFDDGGSFYDHNGEELKNVIGWTDMPLIDVECSVSLHG